VPELLPGGTAALPGGTALLPGGTAALSGGTALPPGGTGHALVWFTVLAWGAAEMALRLRLALRPGFLARLHAWPAVAGERLREWTFFVVALAIAAAVIVALRLAQVRWAAIGGGWAIVIAGELVALAGVVLRIWAISVLDQFFTFIVGIADDHRVIQHGPYRVLRHPGYAGALLTLLGIGVALANWLSLLVIFVMPVLALGVRIKVEDETLADALGEEYRAYADRTARLIPGVW
jgi:protein-S-isoprenylcysteine O-methyltransferase Ste14